MQWLIDIIKEIIHGQLGFFDRGDPAVNDFDAGDFIVDNTWRDLDLSAIVPADAKAVCFKVSIRATSLAGVIWLRTKGNINDFNVCYIRIQVANQWLGGDFVVPLPTSRIIQYKISVVPWTNINVCVKGWWLR